MSIFFFIIIIVGLVTAGEVVSKYLDGAANRPAVDPGQQKELDALREQVESLRERVDRLTEEQRFLTRLLEQRPGPASLPEGSETEGPS